MDDYLDSHDYEELVRKEDEEPPPIELKQLLDNMRYEFLDNENKCPVIISKNLSENERNKLILVLVKHREAFGYTLSDIKGIDPSIVTHKITMLDDLEPVVDTQRRLNPKMKEVVRKEVISLLDAGTIYHICDSKWVSTAHCIPRQGGLDAAMNEDGEIVPVGN